MTLQVKWLRPRRASSVGVDQRRIAIGDTPSSARYLVIHCKPKLLVAVRILRKPEGEKNAYT